MPNLADKTTRGIFGKSVIVGASLLADILENLLRLVSDSRDDMQFREYEIQELMAKLLEEQTDIFAEHLLYTDLASFIAGVDWTSKKFPAWLTTELGKDYRGPVFPPPPIFPGRFGSEDGPEELRFPKIEEAAKRLMERDILTQGEFDEASEAAKQRAFTVTGDIDRRTIETVRDTLAEDIREGTSLEGFRDRLEDRLKAGPFNAGHTETVYRTNVQAAFRDGRETLVSNPIVNELFPYQEYIPIHDDRVRHNHLLLGSLGLDETGIYRRDDPFWNYWTPPIDYNCRCAVNLLTIDRAAAKGVKEAQLWLDSGRPPARPEWRLSAIPFNPVPGFGSRGRVGVLA